MDEQKMKAYDQVEEYVGWLAMVTLILGIILGYIIAYFLPKNWYVILVLGAITFYISFQFLQRHISIFDGEIKNE